MKISILKRAAILLLATLLPLAAVGCAAPEEEKEPPVPAKVTVSLLSEEDEAALPAHTTVEAAIDEYVVRMLLNTDSTVTDFTVYRVEITYEGLMEIGETVYHQDSWAADESLVLTASFPGVYPPLGIIYTDGTGTQYHMHIVMSGKDGSIQLENA